MGQQLVQLELIFCGSEGVAAELLLLDEQGTPVKRIASPLRQQQAGCCIGSEASADSMADSHAAAGAPAFSSEASSPTASSEEQLALSSGGAPSVQQQEQQQPSGGGGEEQHGEVSTAGAASCAAEPSPQQPEQAPALLQSLASGGCTTRSAGRRQELLRTVASLLQQLADQEQGGELGGAAGEEGGLPAGGARRPEPWGIDDVERLLGLELEVIRLQQALQILQLEFESRSELVEALEGRLRAAQREAAVAEQRAVHLADTVQQLQGECQEAESGRAAAEQHLRTAQARLWEWETERARQERGRRERELQLRKENQLLKSQIGAACGNLKALGIPAAKVFSRSAVAHAQLASPPDSPAPEGLLLLTDRSVRSERGGPAGGPYHHCDSRPASARGLPRPPAVPRLQLGALAPAGPRLGPEGAHQPEVAACPSQPAHPQQQPLVEIGSAAQAQQLMTAAAAAAAGPAVAAEVGGGSCSSPTLQLRGAQAASSHSTAGSPPSQQQQQQRVAIPEAASCQPQLLQGPAQVALVPGPQLQALLGAKLQVSPQLLSRRGSPSPAAARVEAALLAGQQLAPEGAAVAPVAGMQGAISSQGLVTQGLGLAAAAAGAPAPAAEPAADPAGGRDDATPEASTGSNAGRSSDEEGATHLHSALAALAAAPAALPMAVAAAGGAALTPLGTAAHAAAGQPGLKGKQQQHHQLQQYGQQGGWGEGRGAPGAGMPLSARSDGGLIAAYRPPIQQGRQHQLRHSYASFAGSCAPQPKPGPSNLGAGAGKGAAAQQQQQQQRPTYAQLDDFHDLRQAYAVVMASQEDVAAKWAQRLSSRSAVETDPDTVAATVKGLVELFEESGVPLPLRHTAGCQYALGCSGKAVAMRLVNGRLMVRSGPSNVDVFAWLAKQPLPPQRGC